jgi:hypothetical protein
VAKVRTPGADAPSGNRRPCSRNSTLCPFETSPLFKLRKLG